MPFATCVASRRQVVWVARQVLDLTLGDAIDDLLLSHIQSLRTASTIASLLGSLQQVRKSCPGHCSTPSLRRRGWHMLLWGPGSC